MSYAQDLGATREGRNRPDENVATAKLARDLKYLFPEEKKPPRFLSSILSMSTAYFNCVKCVKLHMQA